MIKGGSCLFMSKTVICVVYVNYCLFWEHSQSDIDNVMKYFNKDGPSYNLEHSEEDSLSEFLFICIKTLDDGGFNFYRTGLIRKVLEATGMGHCNELPKPTKVEAPFGAYENGSEANRDSPSSYASVIGMMLYLKSNTKPNSSFSVHQCAWFTHNTKVSHDISMKRILWYLQGTK